MSLRRFRLHLMAAFAVALLAGCGSDALTTPAPPTASGLAPATTPAAAAPTAGGSCTPAPTNASTPSSQDNFTDPVCLVTQPDGLQLGDIVTGSGPVPVKGQNMTVQYTGWLTNGSMFDSSRKPGGTPFSFAIGTGGVIRGWDEGLLSMHVGGKRRLVIPPALGYGSQPNGAIPASSTLVFEVELLSVGAPSPS